MPESSPDKYRLTRQRDSFTLHEAANLLCDAQLARTFREPALRDGAERDDYAKYYEAHKLLVQSIADGLLPLVSTSPPRPDGSPDLDNGVVLESSLRAWARARGIAWGYFEDPAPVAQSTTSPRAGTASAADDEQAVHAGLTKDDPDSLKERERSTLLSIIGVLCEAAGIDLSRDTQGHGEAKLILEFGRPRGLRLSAETIAKKIAAAREQIHPKGPASLTGDSNSNAHDSNSNK